MWKILTKCIDEQVQDLTLSDKTSTKSPDPTSLALLLFSVVQLRRKETGIKRYSLQKRDMCTKRSVSPRMTTTSVSDHGGPLTERGLWGLGTITSPHQSSPSSVISGTGMRPNAVSIPGHSEGLYNQEHLKYILGVMSYSHCDIINRVSVMTKIQWMQCYIQWV